MNVKPEPRYIPSPLGQAGLLVLAAVQNRIFSLFYSNSTECIHQVSLEKLDRAIGHTRRGGFLIGELTTQLSGTGREFLQQQDEPSDKVQGLLWNVLKAQRGLNLSGKAKSWDGLWTELQKVRMAVCRI